MRGLFFGIYTALIITVSAFSGIIVVIFVFIPATLISIVLCYAVSEFCCDVDKKVALFIPAILAVADCIVMLLLVNLVFRVVIIIV